jgi:hypothetical protein
MTKPHDPIADLIIDGLGGTSAVAELCQCSAAAVSQWRIEGIPRSRMQFLRVIRPKFDWAQVPDDYPPREPKPDIVEAIKASDDVQPPVGGSNKGIKRSRKLM